MVILRGMVATSAIHDGKRDKEDYTDVCHPGTREDQLKDLEAWAEDAPTDERVRWANAIAGAGKTAMFRTLCAMLEEQSGLPQVSFFVWKGDTRRNSLDHFPATIAAQLCRRISALIPYVEKAINEDSFLLQSTFKKQMDKLVIRPLLDACDAIKNERHLIIVVDGIDELDEMGQTQFLNFVPDFLSRLSSLPISLLVSSRPDAGIVAAFKHPKLATITKAIRLGASDKDICKFIDDKFDDINLRYTYLEKQYGCKWPNQEKRAIMVRQSSGLFIWPVVAFGHIDKVEKGLRHNERLEQVLSSAHPKIWVASPLDNLYRTILEAHAPEEPTELSRFNRRLALLCLPVDLGKFVWLARLNTPILDWTDTPVRAVFGETVDEIWDSMDGLSSLFSPRSPLTVGELPTPGISHRSLRDFTFNRARCGDKFYYSSEPQLHTEVACKIIKFFNKKQAYQVSYMAGILSVADTFIAKSCAEMSGSFIERASKFLTPHLEGAALSEELVCCMDDVTLDSIPTTWPLVTQTYLISKLLSGLYTLAKSSVSKVILDPWLWLTHRQEFPEGPRRREALLSKIMVFLDSRAATAQEWDLGLLRLALDVKSDPAVDSYHSVHCWHGAHSPQCLCPHAFSHNLLFSRYGIELSGSTLVHHVSERLALKGKGNSAQDCLSVLNFFLSLSETGECASGLSSFIPMYVRFYLLLCCIDSCSAGLMTGFTCCSRNVPQKLPCTTPLGPYAQPLCQICQSEKRKAVITL